MQKLWILLAGEYVPPPMPPKSSATVIAVDGGIVHAQTLRATPNIWLGDFDSADEKHYPDLAREVHPQAKDKTDFELALIYANHNYPNHEYHIIGSGGGEADHAFANLWVLSQTSAPVILWQKNAILIHGQGNIKIHWQTDIGNKISLFAITPLTGVNSRGLRWQLDNANILPYCGHATRNEMTENLGMISWKNGNGLLFLPPNCQQEPQIEAYYSTTP